MALQSSGAISLANIQTEFGGSNPISLSEYYGVASGVPSSGTISLSNFYGTSSIASAGLYQINSFAATSENEWVDLIQNVESYNFQSEFRVVFRYQNGTQGTSFRGDFQIDRVNIVTNSGGIHAATFESNSDNYQTSTGATESDTYSSVSSWTDVLIDTTVSRWNRLQSGTPTSLTGADADYPISGDWFLYAETSASGASGKYYWLRSPTITWNYAEKIESVRILYGAYGDNVGTLTTYIEVL